MQTFYTTILIDPKEGQYLLQEIQAWGILRPNETIRLAGNRPYTNTVLLVEGTEPLSIEARMALTSCGLKFSPR